MNSINTMTTIKKSIIAASVATLVGTLAGASDASSANTTAASSASPLRTNGGASHAMKPMNHGYDANVCRSGVHLRAAPCPTCGVIAVIPYPSVVHVYDTQAQPSGWAYGYAHINGQAVHGYFPTSTWQC